MGNGADTLLVRVNDSLTLNAGSVTESFDEELQRSVYAVEPPPTPMFDQLLAYLRESPDTVDVTRFQVRYLGVGLAALAVRWGTYLATLMDPATPFHDTIPTAPSARQPNSISYLRQTEMKRLNIEISHNLSRLGRMYRDEPIGCFSLFSKAYVHLPFPVRTVKPDRELEDGLWRALLEGSVRVRLARDPDQMSALSHELGIPLDPQSFQVKEIGAVDPDRIIGNYLTHSAWRNTAIEHYHAGGWADPPLLPHHRRFSQRDERLLLKEIGNNMAVVIRLMGAYFDPRRPDFQRSEKMMVRYPETATAVHSVSPLFFHTYPDGWALSESSCTVML